MTKLLNKTQVREILGVSASTLERIIAEGKLPYYRIRGQLRFNEQELMNYIASCKEKKVSFEVVVPRAPDDPAPAKKRTRAKAVQLPTKYYPGMKVV